MRMKTILYITLIAAAMLFVGCSGGGGGGGSNANETALIIGEEILIEEGDKLLAENNAEINVVHEVDNTTKKVTLISGTATLIKGDYVLVDK